MQTEMDFWCDFGSWPVLSKPATHAFLGYHSGYASEDCPVNPTDAKTPLCKDRILSCL